MKRGLKLRERPAQNLERLDDQDFLVKDSYWRWPERNQAGNAIALFVTVLGHPFHDAKRQILGSQTVL